MELSVDDQLKLIGRAYDRLRQDGETDRALGMRVYLDKKKTRIKSVKEDLSRTAISQYEIENPIERVTAEELT
jgi:hypothetical protein